MNYAIVNATEEDREELLALYKAQIGRECCPWDEEYPGEESIDWDLSRDALYVLGSAGVFLLLRLVPVAQLLGNQVVR